jgi:hypothetical protein
MDYQSIYQARMAAESAVENLEHRILEWIFEY